MDHDKIIRNLLERPEDQIPVLPEMKGTFDLEIIANTLESQINTGKSFQLQRSEGKLTPIITPLTDDEIAKRKDLLDKINKFIKAVKNLELEQLNTDK